MRIRALSALAALSAITAAPASAAQCDDSSGLLGGVVSVVDGLFGTSMGPAAEDCAPDPDPILDPSVPKVPNDVDEPTVDEPTVEEPRAAVPPVTASRQPPPVAATPTDAEPSDVSAPVRPALDIDVEPPYALGPTIHTASSAVPVGVASALVTAVIVGMIAALLGRRQGRHAAYAQAGALLELIDDAVLVTDTAGAVTMGNATAVSLLGKQVRGRPLSDVLVGVDDTGAPLVRAIASSRGSVTFTGTITRDGGPVPVRVAVSPIGARFHTGSVIAIRNLREQRRLEQLKTEILANVGHELRTPLTSALGFARLAATRELGPEKTKAFVAAVVESCERLERVIDLLVDAATVGAGRPTTVDRVKIDALVRERVKRIEARAPAHVFSVRQTGRARALAANRALLAHAIDEVLDNAVKFSPDGGLITIHVTDAGEAVEISVADQGIGIAEEHLDRLWGDFQQVDASATRRFGGLGLGLAFVRRVVRAHGGTIEVDSETGRGSTFRITLPVRDARGIDTAPIVALPAERHGVRVG